MKTVIIVMSVALVVAFALFGVAEASKKLIYGNKIAEVLSANNVEIYEVKVSTSTTCYVSTVHKYGSQAISCVK